MLYDSAMEPTWTFLTNHAHVLITIARDPEIRMRDIAGRVGITERAAFRIVGDLADAGYLVRSRVGRRSRYRLALDRKMRHEVERPGSVRQLVDAFLTPEDG